MHATPKRIPRQRRRPLGATRSQKPVPRTLLPTLASSKPPLTTLASHTMACNANAAPTIAHATHAAPRSRLLQAPLLTPRPVPRPAQAHATPAHAAQSALHGRSHRPHGAPPHAHTCGRPAANERKSSVVRSPLYSLTMDPALQGPRQASVSTSARAPASEQSQNVKHCSERSEYKSSAHSAPFESGLLLQRQLHHDQQRSVRASHCCFLSRSLRHHLISPRHSAPIPALRPLQLNPAYTPASPALAGSILTGR